MKKGSALLIVLGMLSFMLFSGLAFSVYMRQSRLPSSFIRRTALTGELSKAAVAEAMTEINNAIGNDPHPGVYRADDDGQGEVDEDVRSHDETFNVWYRRVFCFGQKKIGPRYSSDPSRWFGTPKYDNSRDREDEIRNRKLLDNLDDNNSDNFTVPTLTLEGLAYLPPHLVNEARVYSRRTPTARWHPFDFEAGRYAYTAIDVSDCLDVNRVPVAAHRTSASTSRITLAHAFEDTMHQQGAKQQELNAYETMLQQNTYPFISLADWNLAMNKNMLQIGGYKPPFVSYLGENAGDPCAIDFTEDETFPKVSAYRSMAFVTDSSLVADDELKDIEDVKNQPFEYEYLNSTANKSLDQFVLDTGGFFSRNTELWTEHYLKLVSRLGMVALADYLDTDSVPISLAVPTVEKIPMLCAIRPELNEQNELTLKLVKTGNPESEGELLGPNGEGKPADGVGLKTRQVSCWFAYELDGAGLNSAGAGINAMALFPFCRNDEAKQFNVDGQVALFFTRSGKDVPLVIGGNSTEKGLLMLPEPVTEFQDAGVLKMAVGNAPIKVDSYKSELGGLDGKTQLEISKHDLQISGFRTVSQLLPQNGDATKPASKACIARILIEWTQNNDAKEGEEANWTPTKPPDKGSVVKKAESGFGLIDENGNAVNDILELVKDGAELELNLAVWLRVKPQNSGRVRAVDMVPAWYRDDVNQGLAGSAGGRASAAYQPQGADADCKRLIRFKFSCDGNRKILSLNPKNLDQACTARNLKLEETTLVCADPRFNHNPYNWFKSSETDVRQAWKSGAHFGDSGKDGDYFMSVSDQGYLQSVYELAFLPRTTDPETLRQETRRGDLATVAEYLGGKDPAEHPGSFAGCIDWKNMWYTYSPFSVNGQRAVDFALAKLTSGVSGLNICGQKMNPYSDSVGALSAVFANTPLDWRAAATNDQAETAIEFEVDEPVEFNKKYAWNEYNAAAKLPWFEGVLKLAKRFQNEMRNCGDIDEWEDVYGSLWDRNGTDQRRLMGVDVVEEDTFTSVDRKFFYGYWHDCFAVQQQLFLIFVRAEPMMMGGGVAGVAPPQLASRAVALVWRDPRPTKIDKITKKPIPHAMRVLFYHPLD